jgi:hypothetical protein
MIKPQLYIDTGKTNQTDESIESNWLLSDINESASIVIKDAIKKAKDVGKVFTAYTNPFTLPASKRNNIIFKRFSNNKVYEGFDPRRKYDARIQLNGIDFKKGYIKLNKVNMVNNQPLSYSVQFFGELASLKDTLSETKLRDLTGLVKYAFPYTNENIQKGFETGFDVVINNGAGLRQESSITVTQVPTQTGNVTVTLNSVDYIFQVSGGSGATLASVASNISTEINLISGYSSSSSDDVAIVVSDVNQVETPIGFSYGSAVGLLVVLATIQTGTDLPQNITEVSTIENDKGMFKFPLLSHTRGFEYTKTIGTPTYYEGFHILLTDTEKQDMSAPIVSSKRLDILDLKPAIKVPFIFTAIENQFSNISFNKEWLFDISGGGQEASPINEMYLWLHNRKGYLGDETLFTWERLAKGNGNGEDEGEWEFDYGDTGDRRPFEVTSFQTQYRDYEFTARIRIYEIQGVGKFKLRNRYYRLGSTEVLKDDFLDFVVEQGDDNILALDSSYRPPSAGSYYIKTTITCETQAISFKPRLIFQETEKTDNQGGGGTYITNFNSGGSENRVITISNIDPSNLMPDYKVIDFLSDLFKLYNLVAFEEVQDDGSYKINIQSYDYYINNGFEYDITQYIDIKKSTVERISPFSVINYSFAKPKTFLAINQKELTGDDFGNVTFNVNNFTEGDDSNNSLLFDGGKYEVKPKLEKMMYERLSDSEDILTPIQWGWFVNDNKENVPEPAIGKPLFMFTVNRVIGPPLQNTYPIIWSDGHVSYKYISPSNVNSTGSQTLHFNSEFDEYTRQLNESSLFENFHSNYIRGIYSSFARKIKLDAFLPPMIFTRLRLNDTIIVDGISYFIDTMDINITTSKTKFSLLRVTDIETRLKGKVQGSTSLEKETGIWNLESKKWESLEKSSISYFNNRYYLRVSDDGGTVESLECLDNLGIINYNWEYYFRVSDDGGETESLGCIDL